MSDNFKRELSPAWRILTISVPSSLLLFYTIGSLRYGSIVYGELEKGVTSNQLKERVSELPQPTKFFAQSFYPAKMIASKIYDSKVQDRN